MLEFIILEPASSAIMRGPYPSGAIGKITDERSGTICDRSNFFTGQRAMHAALKGVPPWPN
jgi:hypothetical protein